MNELSIDGDGRDAPAQTIHGRRRVHRMHHAGQPEDFETARTLEGSVHSGPECPNKK